MSFFSRIKDPGLKKSLAEVEAAFLEAQEVVSIAESTVNESHRLRKSGKVLPIGGDSDALDEAVERAEQRLDAAKKKLPAELMAIAKRVKIEYEMDWQKAEGRK